MTADGFQRTGTRAVVNRRWRWRWIHAALVALAISATVCVVAYYRPARLDGEVRYVACACGFKRAKIFNEEVILLEPNHARPANSVVATFRIEDGRCILRRIREDGTADIDEPYVIDHLGAKYYDESRGCSVYILMVDNWKLYPYVALARIANMFQ